MARKYSWKEQALDLHDRDWSVEEDVYLIENQNLPVEEQAAQLKLTIDEVAARRKRLGLLRRAMAVSRLENQT